MIKEIKEAGYSHCKIVTVNKSKKVFFITIDNKIVYKIKTNYQEEILKGYFYWYKVKEDKDIRINRGELISEFRMIIESELMNIIDYYIF